MKYKCSKIIVTATDLLLNVSVNEFLEIVDALVIKKTWWYNCLNHPVDLTRLFKNGN